MRWWLSTFSGRLRAQFVRVNTYVLFLMSNTNKPSWQWRISLGFPSNL